jgi:hypothetical protein
MNQNVSLIDGEFSKNSRYDLRIAAIFSGIPRISIFDGSLVYGVFFPEPEQHLNIHLCAFFRKQLFNNLIIIIHF